MNILEAKNISFTYDKNSPFQLKDVSMAIPKGKITALVGPNGSGKSTLFSCFTGENKVEQGQVLYKNQPLDQVPIKDRSQELAVVYQSYDSNLLLTVEDVVAMGRTPYKRVFDSLNSYDRTVIAGAIETVGISQLKDYRMSDLSGGQRQLVWLALALAQEPEVILLDEPTSYLDVSNQRMFLDLVKKLNQDRSLTVCMILHDLNQVIRYTDYVYLLKDGCIKHSGRPDQVLSQENIQSVYQVQVERLLNSHGEYVIDLY